MKKILIGCGILQKEIDLIIKKNGWDIETLFLDSSLHIDFDKLYQGLSFLLEKNKNQEITVFYGVCHPKIDALLKQYNAKRTPVQNCIEILLGKELFTKELSNGAFFLIEDWVLRFDNIFLDSLFGKNNIEGVKMILQSEHKYFCCIKTPCSSDFSLKTEGLSKKYSMPLKWISASLNNLERILKDTIWK
ncbi:MAG TPA: DUF1638 domain-containing protein [Spirochaetota bacterium]|nr:DUF1638 domain-containing protein [Spirochaetota bacterium]